MTDDGSPNLAEILREIRDGQKNHDKALNEILTRLAVLDAYNVPKMREDINANEDRLTAIETKLKVWAAGMGFLFMVLGFLLQEAFKYIWPNSH